MRFSTLLSATALFELGLAGYTLEDDYMKEDFYTNFNFFTGADPTQGFVEFVNEATAKSTGLISANATGAAQWGVDHTNKCPNGRPSIRLESKKTYSSGLIVLDVAHMPFGCGTWPAFWTVGPNWPSNGEIDIIEGVHEQATDSMTLHTGPGCTIGKDIAAFSGNLSTPNCDIHASGQDENAGCGIHSTNTKSYGAGLNANNGGVYATEWTAEGISIYFFPRGAIPSDVLGDNPNPSGWGKPAAKFDGACDIPTMFKNHQIVFDTTFCGQWAGKVWSSSSCASKAPTCNAFVQNNPEAFVDAYWEINALKVYQSNGQTSYPTQPGTPGQSTAISQPIAQPTYSGAPVPLPSSKTPVAPTYPANPLPSSKAPAAPAPSSSKTAPAAPGYGSPAPSSKHHHHSSAAAAPSDIASYPSDPSNKGQDDAHSVAPVSPAKPTGASPSAASPSGAAPAPANGDGMSGFQWPKAGSGQSGQTGQSNNATGTQPPAAPQSTGAVVSPVAANELPQASGAVMSEALGPKPTNGNGSPPAVPYIPEVTQLVEVTKTVEKTVYVTDDAAVATPPANKAKMVRFLKEHRRGLTRHYHGH